MQTNSSRVLTEIFMIFNTWTFLNNSFIWLFDFLTLDDWKRPVNDVSCLEILVLKYCWNLYKMVLKHLLPYFQSRWELDYFWIFNKATKDMSFILCVILCVIWTLWQYLFMLFFEILLKYCWNKSIASMSM